MVYVPVMQPENYPQIKIWGKDRPHKVLGFSQMVGNSVSHILFNLTMLFRMFTSFVLIKFIGLILVDNII